MSCRGNHAHVVPYFLPVRPAIDRTGGRPGRPCRRMWLRACVRARKQRGHGSVKLGQTWSTWSTAGKPQRWHRHRSGLGTRHFTARQPSGVQATKQAGMPGTHALHSSCEPRNLRALPCAYWDPAYATPSRFWWFISVGECCAVNDCYMQHAGA